MRQFSIEEVIAHSGLTRGQIDQFIGRWGYGIYGSPGPFRCRMFCATDLFNLMLVGTLRQLGLSMPAIRDIVVGGLGMYRWDTDLNRPADMFPGQAYGSGVRQFIVLRQSEGCWYRQVVKAEDLRGTYGPRGTTALLIDATGYVDRIHAAALLEDFAS
ncbi:hypothetical protein [Methylobacterium sp. SI9]|uniref:hypothetical protein n=1 Tax=Methylobacterium guangdongense TaxID=3138811 RepID=UPI00313C6661